MNLDQLLDAGEAHARGVLIGTKEQIVPFFHLVHADGRGSIVATPWTNEEEKYAMADAFRATLRDAAVMRYMFICEAWMAKAPKGWELGDPLVKPSRQPDRVETVVIAACDAKTERVRLLEIKRGADGECVGLQLTPISGPVARAAVFSNMLAPDA